MKLAVFVLLSAFVGVLPSCKNQETASNPPATPSMTPTELAAKFPYDLGPGTVDVSAYPREIQEDYKLFLAVCSGCHTSARPLNSPYAARSDWHRFIHRMHVKINDRGFTLDPNDEKKIEDFLAYDAKVRKIGHRAEFEAQQGALKTQFQEVVKERDRLIDEETRRLPKKETPYVGTK